MSYSLSVRAPSKTDALAAAAVKLDEVIAKQPAHALDREAALGNLKAHLALLEAPKDTEEVVASMYGSMAVQDFGATASQRVMSVGSSCSATLERKEA